jgi:hypothetical protein
VPLFRAVSYDSSDNDDDSWASRHVAFIGSLMIRRAIEDAAGIDEEHEKRSG